MRPEYVKELLAPTLNARHLANGRRISLTGRSWFGRCFWGLVSCLGITLSFLGGEEKKIEVKIMSSVCCSFHSVRWPVICLSETLALQNPVSRPSVQHGVLKFWSSFVHPGSDRGRLSLEKGLFWIRMAHVNWHNNYVLVFHLETDVAVFVSVSSYHFLMTFRKRRNDPIPASQDQHQGVLLNTRPTDWQALQPRNVKIPMELELLRKSLVVFLRKNAIFESWGFCWGSVLGTFNQYSTLRPWAVEGTLWPNDDIK